MRRSAITPFPAVPEVVRQRMARIAKSATRPELLVRHAVRSLGVGYRLNRRDLPGTPDLAFIRRRTAIFAYGSF